MYYPVATRITPLTTIRRERLLPARGEVLVQSGEQVGPADVVARCQLPGTISVVDVSHILGVRRDRAASYLRKAVGDPVQADEVLAAPRGPIGRLRHACQSPVAGHIVAMRNGVALIEADAITCELRAHVKGQVTNVMPNVGAVVSTVGALIQATWGSGGDAAGILKLVVDAPTKPIRAAAIDVSCHGTLIVGGRIRDGQTLEQAAQAQVRGIITGSVSAGLRPVLESLPFPVLITEGFGTWPMSQQVFSLLEAHAGREAMVCADTRNRWDARRPEVVIPLHAEGDVPLEDAAPQPLQPGMRVKVVRAPYLGAIGTVTDLPIPSQPVESGLCLPVAEVDLEKDEPVLIALANLEVIR